MNYSMKHNPFPWFDFEVPVGDWVLGSSNWTDSVWPPIATAACSSLGLGTAGLKAERGLDDGARLIQSALRGNLRIVDCATIYGGGFAEAATGVAVRQSIREHELERGDLFVISKAGYRLNDTGDKIERCIARDFIRREIDASRRRLGLSHIDAYLLHNPEEDLAQGSAGWDAIGQVFDCFEAAVADGVIGCYGVSAAEGFIGGRKDFHPLDRLLQEATRVAGASHHFRLIELPTSLWRRESFRDSRYRLHNEPATLLELAADAGLRVIGSIPMAGGHGDPRVFDVLTQNLPIDESQSHAMTALQFARSIPFVHAVIPGISSHNNIAEVTALAAQPRWNLIG